MGTQDEKNGAAPQNEFISGFKGGAISPGNEPQQPFVTRPKKTGTGLSSGKQASTLQSRIGANPYQLTQQMSKNKVTEQFSSVPFEKNSGQGFIRKIKDKFFNGDSGSGAARQKIMVVMIPILFIVMIFMFRQVLWKAPKKTKGAAREDKAVAVNKSSNSEIEWNIPDPIPAGMRDPIKFGENTTDSSNSQATSLNDDAGTMNVKSILFSDDKPSAVIGHKLVYLNDKINGATVVDIQNDYVVFEKDGKKWSQKVAEDVSPQSKRKN